VRFVVVLCKLIAMGEFIGGNGGFCEMKISWRDTWRG